MEKQTLAWKCWQKGTCLTLVDPILKANRSSMQDIVTCIHIGLLCVQELAADRPSMCDVVLMLSSTSLTFPRPSEPAYFKHGSISSELEESDSAGCESSSRFQKVILVVYDMPGSWVGVGWTGVIDFAEPTSQVAKDRLLQARLWNRMPTMGKLPKGQEIAVKRLSINSAQGEQQLRNDVLVVAEIRHKNLVKILGYCFEAAERLLVNEFVPNSSLDHFLF
ncbi:hypothetical protein RJ639_006067, partial [Escallonia herrerae]